MWYSLKKTALGLLATAVLAVWASPVEVNLSSAKTALKNSDDVVVRVTFSNNTAVPQRVLKWHTPFAGVEEDLFQITRDGMDVDYLGAHYKRPAPTAKDYYVLQPGKSYTRSVELSALYDLSKTGTYNIEYNTHSFNLFVKEFDQTGRAVASKNAGEMKSGGLMLWIEGQQYGAPVVDLKGGPIVQAASLGYTNCTSSQQSTIATAITNATGYSSNSNSYLQANNQGSRYTTWFGAYTSARYNTVKSHFASILDAFQTKNIVVDCKCKQNYYAYVYPTQPYKIYVCKSFWTAPATGTDSKAGTLVHEMSHFNVVAGTDDHAYGQSAAKSLAISNPANAVDNADNHEYFAENTPALN